MKFLRTLIVLSTILLIQTMVLGRYPWLRLIDLFLLMNIYCALNYNQLSCMAVSIGTGLIQDSFSKGILGVNAFSKTVVVYLIAGLSSRLMIKHPMIIMLLIGVAYYLDFWIVAGLHALFRLPHAMVPYWTLLIGSGINGALGMFAFQISDRIRMRKEYA